MTIAYQSIFSIILAFVLMSTSEISAQDNRMSEEDIKQEELFIEALSKRMEGDTEKALEIFQGIASKDRRNHTVLYEIARIQKKSDKEMEAIQTIDRAIRIDSENIWYHLFKAGVQEMIGDYIGAAETQTSVIQLDPYNSRHYFRKADNYLRVNKVQDALNALADLENKNGSFEELHQRRYDIYRNSGQISLAVNEIYSLLQLFPANTEYLYMLANHMNLSGQGAKADSLFQIILQLDPDDARAQLALASAYKSGNSSDVEYLTGLKKLFANPEAQLDPKIIELIPFVEKLTTQPDPDLGSRLIELMESIEKAHPKEAKVHALKGDILQLSSKRSEAISEYKKALKLEKGVFTVWEQILYLQTEAGDFEDMYETSEDALDIFPNQARLWVFSAKALRGLKQYPNALNSLDQAQMMASGQTPLLQEIAAIRGAILFDQGKSGEAYKSFDEAVALNPENIAIVSRQAFYKALTPTQTEAAGKQLSSMLNKNPNHPLLVGTFSVINLLLDKQEEALASIENYKNKDTPLARLYSLIENKADINQILQFWKSVLEGGAS